MSLPENILHPLNFTITDFTDEGHDYHFKVEAPDPDFCQRCGVLERPVRFGKAQQSYRDIPIHGKRVTLWLVRRRYRCAACGGTFRPDLADLDDKRQMTRRLVEYVERAVLQRTNLNVAQETGLDEKTVRQILADFLARHEQDHDPEPPTWLGLDEVYVGRKFRLIATNLEQNTVIDLLEDRFQPTVQRYLHKVARAGTVELVCTDMYETYRKAVRQILPDAMLVTDKFHVVSKANEALEGVRKTIRKGLKRGQRIQLKNDRKLLLMRRHDLDPMAELKVETWTNAFPELGEAYRLKEDFYGIYDARDDLEARERYEAWLASVPESQKTAWKDVIGLMSRWDEEIFGYFQLERPMTNAFTESFNRLIKDKQRAARGLSFEVCRAKILFGQKHKVVREKTRKSTPFALTGHRMQTASTETRLVDYGVPISTVIGLMEEGEL